MSDVDILVRTSFGSLEVVLRESADKYIMECILRLGMHPSKLRTIDDTDEAVAQGTILKMYPSAERLARGLLVKWAKSYQSQITRWELYSKV